MQPPPVVPLARITPAQVLVQSPMPRDLVSLPLLVDTATAFIITGSTRGKVEHNIPGKHIGKDRTLTWLATPAQNLCLPNTLTQTQHPTSCQLLWLKFCEQVHPSALFIPGVGKIMPHRHPQQMAPLLAHKLWLWQSLLSFEVLHQTMLEWAFSHSHLFLLFRAY